MTAAREASQRRPRVNRTKTSSAVVDYVLEELFAGRLKSGDRIDLDEVGQALDVSRIPVREALLILERDGIVSTRYHRGVYVEPFDAESILDDFEILGLLSGIAVRRLAERPDPDAIARLQALIGELRAVESDDPDELLRLVQEILTIEHRAGGSRRLRAELRAFTGFLPAALQVGVGRGHAATAEAHAQVVRAIVAGDGAKAAEYRLQDFRTAGQNIARELQRRGVLA
jgi:DNA-binding GntR family transcriptional regulator